MRAELKDSDVSYRFPVSRAASCQLKKLQTLWSVLSCGGEVSERMLVLSERRSTKATGDGLSVGVRLLLLLQSGAAAGWAGEANSNCAN
jgi:hypothetical protein